MGLCKIRPQYRIAEIFCMVGVLGWLGSYWERARSLWIKTFCYAGYDACRGFIYAFSSHRSGEPPGLYNKLDVYWIGGSAWTFNCICSFLSYIPCGAILLPYN